MFDPNEESMVLDMLSNIFDIPADDMIKIGELTKKLFLSQGVETEEQSIEQMKKALMEMPKENILVAGAFISGLLRCNVIPQLQQNMQYKEDSGLE